jgi:Tetratricopeptide repeat
MGRRRNDNTLLWVVLGGVGLLYIVLVLIGVGMGFYIARQPGLAKLPPPVAEDPEAKRAATVAAFRGPPADLTSPEAASIQRFFTNLGQSMRGTDGDRIAAHFNLERMFQEIDRQGVLPQLSAREQREFVTGMSRSFPRSMTQLAALMRWDRFTIRRLQLSADGNEALVYARHDTPDGLRMKMRWWLVRHGDWAVYDFEDLDQGMRVSNLLAVATAALVSSGGRSTPWLSAIPNFRQATLALSGQDYDALATALKPLRAHTFPGPIQALRWFLEAGLSLGRGQPREALDALDRATALAPDFPAVALLRAIAHNRLGQPIEAERWARDYLDYLGDDAAGYSQLVTAMAQLERPADEIRDACRKGLDDDPDWPVLVAILRRYLPDDQKPEFGQRFAALAKPADSFAELARQTLTDHDLAGLDALLSAYQPDAAGKPARDYYSARLAIGRGRTDEAARLFPGAFRGARNEEQRREYLDGFLSAMIEAGKPLDGYRAVPDATAAFTALAELLDDDDSDLDDPKATAWLNELVAAHGAKHADDPRLPFYAGRVAVRSADYAAAEKHFAAGMKRELDDELRESYRHERVHARFAAGDGLSAYRDIGPSEKTFTQLAFLFTGEKDPVPNLTALIAAHKKAVPLDPNLPSWEIERLWLKHEYTAIVERLQADRAPLAKEQARRTVIQDRLIRSLVRLKRTDEARRECDVLGENYSAPVLSALTAATAGDVARVTAAADEYAAAHGDFPAYWFYNDPDLGPLLRGPAFAEFRKKYPPPPERNQKPDL